MSVYLETPKRPLKPGKSPLWLMVITEANRQRPGTFGEVWGTHTDEDGWHVEEYSHHYVLLEPSSRTAAQELTGIGREAQARLVSKDDTGDRILRYAAFEVECVTGVPLRVQEATAPAGVR